MTLQYSTVRRCLQPLITVRNYFNAFDDWMHGKKLRNGKIMLIDFAVPI